MKRLRVAVLYGGRSGEHEVSLASAAAVLANLDRKKYEPVGVRLEKDGRWILADRLPSASSAAEVI
jgi:D-alanine-D-alanine ligase